MRLIDNKYTTVIESMCDLVSLLDFLFYERRKLLNDSVDYYDKYDYLTESIHKIQLYRTYTFDTLTITFDKNFSFIYDIIRTNYSASIHVNL